MSEENLDCAASGLIGGRPLWQLLVEWRKNLCGHLSDELYKEKDSCLMLGLIRLAADQDDDVAGQRPRSRNAPTVRLLLDLNCESEPMSLVAQDMGIELLLDVAVVQDLFMEVIEGDWGDEQ